MLSAALPLLLGALGLAGAAISTYFVLVTYRWIRPDARWIPSLCRMDEDTCARVVDTPEARLLGLPNAVYGAAWYAVVAGAAVVAATRGAFPLCPLLLAASAFTVALSAYLAWALLRRLRVRCVLCFTSHALNAAILAVLAAGCLAP